MKYALLTLSALSLLAAGCQAPPAAPEEAQAPIVLAAPPEVLPPRPAGKANWRRVATVNNCNLYEVRYGDSTYLLATSWESSGGRSMGVSCALVPAG